MERKGFTKDKECASCTKLFTCKGKPEGVRCLNYEERKREAEGK